MENQKLIPLQLQRHLVNLYFGFGVLYGMQVKLVDNVSATTLTCTPRRTPKPKYQYSSHGESLKSTSGKV
jgi:hypothetical protein